MSVKCNNKSIFQSISLEHATKIMNVSIEPQSQSNASNFTIRTGLTPASRYYRDFPSGSTRAPAAENSTFNTSSKFSGYYNISSKNISDTEGVPPSHTIDNRQADLTALLGFGISLLIYFCLIIHLAYRGAGAPKRDVDYCLVRKVCFFLFRFFLFIFFHDTFCIGIFVAC